MIRWHHKHYLLSMLVLIAVISFVDRFIFALALEPIKQDLNLTDTQLGLMSGIGFAAFYALAGIPIARWSDRGNRVTIAALAVGLVGVMVSICGLATNFIQLLLAKAGVAVGEAGSVPTTQSLIAEYFDRTERPRATAIYTMSHPISMIVGYLIGGWLIDVVGWRWTFMLIGLPALAIAILVKLTLKEPRLSRQNQVAPVSQPPFVSVLSVLWKQDTFRHLLISFCLSYFFLMGMAQWLAAFFMRSHSVPATELGASLALSWGLTGILGNYLGGYLASRFAARQERLQMLGLIVVMMVFGLLNAMVYLASSLFIAMVFLAASAFVISLTNGVLFSAMQSLVSDSMRSVSTAIIFLFANLVGMGFGPLVLGMLSDFLYPSYGDESLRYASVIFCPGVIWVAFHYWMASRTIEADINSVEEGASSSHEKKSGSNTAGAALAGEINSGKNEC